MERERRDGGGGGGGLRTFKSTTAIRELPVITSPAKLTTTAKISTNSNWSSGKKKNYHSKITAALKF